MNGAPPPSDKVRSSQLEGLLTSQPWKPMRGSSSTARLNPQAGGGGGGSVGAANQAAWSSAGREWQLTLPSIFLKWLLPAFVFYLHPSRDERPPPLLGGRVCLCV